MLRLMLACIVISSVYAQNCPVLPPGTIGTCIENCSADGDCQANEKCCSNGCGHECTAVSSELKSCKSCKYGTLNGVDSNGCPICVRLPQSACKGSLFPNYSCKHQECPSNYQCIVSPTDSYAVCCGCSKCPKGQTCSFSTQPCSIGPCPVVARCITPVECPLLKCIPCEPGLVYRIDENNCQTCECIPQ